MLDNALVGMFKRVEEKSRVIIAEGGDPIANAYRIVELVKQWEKSPRCTDKVGRYALTQTPPWRGFLLPAGFAPCGLFCARTGRALRVRTGCQEHAGGTPAREPRARRREGTPAREGSPARQHARPPTDPSLTALNPDTKCA
jgi:hypothetical protein